MLISGASRGIGARTALQYARAGASLTLVARTQAALDASKEAILRECPSAQVFTFPADVRDVKKAEEAVAATVAHFGRLDILVANAATVRPMDKRTLGRPHVYTVITALVADLFPPPTPQAFASKDPNGWWDVLEVNIRGPYNFIQCGIFIYALSPAELLIALLPSFAVPELLKTKGQVVILGSGVSQLRLPNMSEYCTSKHALLRFAEFVTIGEYHVFFFVFHSF